jgi:hypothetical protein
LDRIFLIAFRIVHQHALDGLGMMNQKCIGEWQPDFGYVNDCFGKQCRQDIKRPTSSLSCARTKPSEAGKPTNAYVASLIKSTTMPM